jgi:hypothetical protein
MTNIVLDPVLIVTIGKMHRELLLFSDIINYVAPEGGEPLMGIGGIVVGARTAEEQENAVILFRDWARKAGLLVGTRPA